MDVTLVLFKKDGSQKAFSLPSNVTVIGRRHDCDLCVPLMVVSRRHCQLTLNNESVKIRDLDSRAGTFLNGERVIDGIIKAGDYLTIGPLTFQVQIGGEPKQVVPPPPAKPAPAAKKTPASKASANKEPSGSFPELELDDSDSFLSELQDI
jgi:pSer/pThr/pTyr-binding forkhead associated (FHA) protein